MATDPKKEMDLEGVGREWEKEEPIRDHLRGDAKRLFPEGVSESIKVCCEEPAHSVLKVLCLRMALVEDLPQPQVAPLRDEIERLYKRCGVTTEDSIVYNDGWVIRKLCVFLKMKTRKHLVSTVSWFGFRIYIYISVSIFECYPFVQ